MEKFKDRLVRREGFGEWYDGGELLIHLLYLLSKEQPRTWTSLKHNLYVNQFWNKKGAWEAKKACSLFGPHICVSTFPMFSDFHNIFLWHESEDI